MKKEIFFDELWGETWPHPDQLRPYFLAESGKEWFYTGGNDSARLSIEGVDGTVGDDEGDERIDADLSMWGHPDYGVLLIYDKWGGGFEETYTSKGDLSRLGELTRSLHDTPLPIGLFIPFAQAWPAVREFMETNGAELPESIEWVNNDELPKNTFPDP